MSETVYKINLNETDTEGNFSCPGCKRIGRKTIINPNDESNVSYEVLETKMKHDEMESLILGCKKCGSKIELKCLPEYIQE
jgi:hypothetical protein